MSVLTLQQFTATYHKQNPNDVVVQPSAVSYPYATILLLAIGLIAVNVLSGSHTAPVIANSVPTKLDWVKVIVGVAGFLGVEFLMFSANFIARDKTGGWQRNIVIGLALVVAIVANVGSVVGTISVAGDLFSVGAGVLIGIFAPIANFATGEMLRKVLEQVKAERRSAKDEYKQALVAYDHKMLIRYVNYLKREGITNPTDIMRLSSGEHVDKSEPTPEPAPEPKEPKPIVRRLKLNNADGRNKATILADDLEAAGDQLLSFSAIQSKYNTNPATVSAAKKILKSRGVIS